MSDKNEYSSDKGYRSIDEILTTNATEQQKLVKNIERQEAIDNLETTDSVEADIKANKEKTKHSKDKFISTITSGLGEEIKTKAPEEKFGKLIKKTWRVRLGLYMKKLFTRF